MNIILVLALPRLHPEFEDSPVKMRCQILVPHFAKLASNNGNKSVLKNIRSVNDPKTFIPQQKQDSQSHQRKIKGSSRNYPSNIT